MEERNVSIMFHGGSYTPYTQSWYACLCVHKRAYRGRPRGYTTSALCVQITPRTKKRESGLKDETGPQDVTSLYESRMKI